MTEPMFLRRRLGVQAQAELGRRGRHAASEYGVTQLSLVVAMALKASPRRPDTRKKRGKRERTREESACRKRKRSRAGEEKRKGIACAQG
jgi:hypothetical protein